MNKRILILLLVILLISGTLLIAFMLNQPKTNPAAINQPINQKQTNQTDQDLDKIKKEMTVGEFNDAVPEDAQITEEEFEKIKQQPVTTAIGKITAKQADGVTVELNHLESTWTSKVSINQNSTIYLPATNPNSMGEVAGLEQLNVGDEVIVNSEETILNKTSFTAFSIHKIQ
jgi:uncharacterized protein YxeA